MTVGSTRIGTYANHQNLLHDTASVQERLAELQGQISSGRKTDTFVGLGNRIEFTTALQTRIRRSDKYVESNNLIKTRLETMNGSISQVLDIAIKLKSMAVTARSATGTEYPIFIQTVKSMMGDAASQLNMSLGGRSLFAGTKTNAEAVPDPIPSLVTDGVADDGYYNGNNEDSTTQISDSLSITYNVRGNEQGFQDLFAAMQTLVTAMENNDQILLDKASQLADSAAEEINAIQSRVNNNINIIEITNQAHDSSVTYLKGVLGTEISTDVVAASTQVAIDQSILQASFSAFAKISSLRLADYLR